MVEASARKVADAKAFERDAMLADALMWALIQESPGRDKRGRIAMVDIMNDLRRDWSLKASPLIRSATAA